MHAGEKFKALRKKKNISTKELMEKLGVKRRQSIYDYEKREYLGIGILKKLADIFEVDIGYFLADNNDSENKVDIGLTYNELLNKYFTALEYNLELQQKLKKCEQKLTKPYENDNS